ncbi:hypothetical protein Tco_0179203 [Tanacetum coccineum]
MWRWRDDDGYEGGEAAGGQMWCGAEEMERVQVVGRWLRWGGSQRGGDVYGGGDDEKMDGHDSGNGLDGIEGCGGGYGTDGLQGGRLHVANPPDVGSEAPEKMRGWGGGEE